MKIAFAAAALLSALPARALAPQGGTAAFAAAYGGAAYAVLTDISGDLAVRRLGLDGNITWQDNWSQGTAETPVGAAVTSWGGLSVVGEDSTGCWAVHWSSRGVRVYADPLQYGSECHARAVLVDATGNTYALGTTTVGGVFNATVWKIDKRGQIQWTYRPTGPASVYAFALTLDAAGDGVTTTTAVSGPSGWVYDTFDVDSDGRPR